MPPDTKIDAAAKILKNSAAIFIAMALAKGGGLIVTILVARYLGTSAFGVFAVILSLTLLLEIMTPIGQQEVIIRAIARDRSLMFKYWINASAVTFLCALGFGIILGALVNVKNFGEGATLSVYIAAAGLPFAGMNLVSQAVLQGLERMEYQPIAAFIGRVLGLIVLWLLLMTGAGIWSAFLGRLVFQVTSLIILSHTIFRYAGLNNLSRKIQINFKACRETLSTSIPFALQKFLTEGFTRINIIILPVLITLEAVGLFNAANQITQTCATIIPIVMLTLLPAFSRSFKEQRENPGLLADQTLKFLLILIFPLVFVITVAADKIIVLLYGAGFEGSVPVLQLIIWSQIIVAVDAVMKQNMIATDNERAMVWRSAVGIAINITLTIVLGRIYGLLGIAAAVLLSRAVLLILDIEFVNRKVYKANFLQGAMKPFACALLSGIVAFALSKHDLFIILPATAGAYLVFLLLLKTFTKEELSLIRQLFRRMLTPFKC